MDILDLSIPRGKFPKKIVLYIPTTLEDALAKAMQEQILPQLKKAWEANTLDHLLIGLDKAQEEDYERLTEQFHHYFGKNVTLLWHDDPHVQSYLQELQEKKHYNLVPGKGRNLWLSMLWHSQTLSDYHIIMHDADIKTYSLKIPYRLARGLTKAPIVKAYYLLLGKINGRKKMYGRVRRLFFYPLLKALKNHAISSSFSPSFLDLLNYLESIKYPLSGEMAFASSIITQLPLQPDWGLETQLLFTWYEKKIPVAQVDLGIYDHKHSPLDEDKQKGLHRMAREIMATFAKTMKAYGIAFTPQFLKTLKNAYLEEACTLIYHTYLPYAQQNGYLYDITEELNTVMIFSDVFEENRTKILHNPLLPLARIPQSIKKRFVDFYRKQNPKKNYYQ